MQNPSLDLRLIGCKTVVGRWWQNEHTHIQRLYYIVKGSGSYFDPDGTAHPFTAGNLYLFPYNFVSDFYSNPDDPFEHLYLDFFSNPPLIAEQPIILTVEPGSPLACLIEYTVTFLKKQDIDLRARSHITSHLARSTERQILYECLRMMLLQISMETELPFAEDAVVKEALAYIHENFREPLTVDELAARVGFSTEHFIRRFKTVMQITPGAYLQKYRLFAASQMIKEGKSVKEAALYCGYDYSSSLCRALGKLR